MSKEELIHLTIKQLSDNLEIAPQNFKLEDTALGPVNGNFISPSIVWQFKVELKQGLLVQDPLNATRTIVISYNKIAQQISCHIYFREVNSWNNGLSADSQATQQLYQYPIFNRNYRAFQKLRKKLLAMKREQEYIDYLKKLNNIFPSTHVDDLFK